MAIGRYQVPEKPASDPGTGPWFASETHADGTVTVHKDRIVICDAAGNIVDTATATPAGTERGLVTRNIPSGVHLVTNATGESVSVDDNAGSLTVDAPQAAPLFVRQTDGTNNAALASASPAGTEVGLVTRNIPSGTQNIRSVRDANRARVLLFSEALAGSATESALLSFTAVTDVTAAAAATSYTVPAGRTLVLTTYDVLVRNTGTATAVGNVRLRLRSAGTAAVANTSPVQWGVGVGWPFAATATLEHNAHKSGSMPEGMEFPAGTILGLNLIASTANMTIALYLNGFTY